MDTPAHRSVIEFVRAGPKEAKFSLDGVRGTGVAQLCRLPPGFNAGQAGPQQGAGRLDCIQIAMEGEPRCLCLSIERAQAKLTRFILCEQRRTSTLPCSSSPSSASYRRTRQRRTSSARRSQSEGSGPPAAVSPCIHTLFPPHASICPTRISMQCACICTIHQLGTYQPGSRPGNSTTCEQRKEGQETDRFPLRCYPIRVRVQTGTGDVRRRKTL